jgi:Homing endonuclease associated repeat
MASKYEKDFLISEFWRYYDEYGIYPRRKDLNNKLGYPSEAGYIRIWGNWDNFLKDIGIVDQNNTDGWYKCDELVLKEFYEEGDQQEIIDKLMVKRSWSAIKFKARKMGLKRNVSKIKRRYSDEFLLSELKRYYEEYNKVPTCADFVQNDNYPHYKVYIKRFGSWNNALKRVGLELNAEFNITKHEIIKKARNFYEENKRSPYWNELGFSRTVYKKYWKQFSDMLIEAGLPLNKKTRIDHFKTDEELINDYLNLYKKLGRIPVANDIDNNPEMASFKTYKKRFGGYRELWKLCGIENNIILDENKYGFICLDKNGDICKSYAEMVITNLFIENNIKYIKEYRYENFIPTLKGSRYAMDWYLPEKDICVEYFGIYRKDQLNKAGEVGKYCRKAIRKMELAKEYGLKLIDIYQEDLNETYLQRLVKKFKSHGINLNVTQKNLYKNNFNKTIV